MAAARKNKRVAASQPGFLKLNPAIDHSESIIGRRKRVNKNKKKNWNKHSDIQDVEEFLDDVRLQEKATGGLVSEKPDDSLFYVDTCVREQPKNIQQGGVQKKGKRSRPLRIDLILQHDSLIPPPKDVLAYQQPNAKKQRRISKRAGELAAKGVLPRRQKQLLRQKAAAGPKVQTPANNHPERPYYDLWTESSKDTADPWYLEQTMKKLVKRPDKLNEKPSALPAVEVIAPGGSYNPEFFSHQALLLQAHEVEVKRQKEEERLERQLAFKREDTATTETRFQEQVEGLLEEEEEEEEEGPVKEGEVPMKEGEDPAQNSSAKPKAHREKKTERQRKREKAEKEKEQRRRVLQSLTGRRQQLFQLRSIRAELKTREQRTKQRQAQRRARQEAQKTMPRRLGKLKFQAPDLEVQLSDEIPGSLRSLRPEGSILKDRFKSLQKRNLIEPRERAKFKRRHKLKYVEKRAFKAIT
ncbi:hypothetical protein AAFF_G00346490 [Aldrovandia affinis]|uniref:Ribosome biogenesis protein NOP53 n=1 Tax=Aldrovandia affinis TaxID=143900 RepID=A0AAD7WNP5_9TELE|nr:hypothetical protein AAFF_G00346490 [Aldrovandia affinis]